MPLENMNDREILMELIKDKRQRDRWRYIKIAALVMVVIALAFTVIRYVVPISRYVKDMSDSMTKIEAEVGSIKAQAEATLNDVNIKLSGVDVDALKGLTDKLKDIDLDAVKSTIDGLGNLVNKFPFLFK